MLKRRLIPTPLVVPSDKKPITIKPVKKVGRFSTIKLVLRLFGFALGSVFSRGTAAEKAVRARQFLEHLGGMWIKAGQLISLRTELLSPEMANELSHLTYQTTGFPPEIARKVVEDGLGRPIDELFSYWEDMPFAAASVSQVHHARLRKKGVAVAVKVQRPGIDEMLTRDMKLIGWILRQMNRLPGLGFITWDGMIRELEQMLGEEVDYRFEAANIRRMRKLLKKHKVYVPKIYQNDSAKTVLTMEYIDGVLMTDYLHAHRNNPAKIRAWCRQNNVKPRKVGSRLMRSFYRQLFEDNLFHGDLHPGNIILLRNNRFSLIDLGTIGNLEKRFVNTYKTVIRSFSEGDYIKSVESYLLLADSIPLIDLTAYRSEMIEVLRQWEARSHLKGLSFYERSFTGGAATELSNIARKYKVNPSWQFLRVGRSLNTMDASASALLGSENPNKIAKKYFRQAQRRSYKRLRKEGFRKFASAAADISENADYFSDMIRRQAIVFQGTQTKVSYILGVLFNFIRLGIAILGIVLLYNFLHQHYFNLIDNVHNPEHFLGSWAERIPPIAYEVGIGVLVLVLIAFLFAGRLKKRLSAPTPRLPSGRLDR